MPGYWAFTDSVRKLLWANRKLFIWTVVVYTLFTAILVGLSSQDTYTQLSTTLRDSSTEIFSGDLGAIGQASILLVSGATGGFSSAPTATQQVFAGILTLLVWLTTVWLLRAILAGRSPRFRDGLYHAGAPIVSTALVVLVLIVQLLPIAIATIAFVAASASGLLAGGVEAMLFWSVASLLVVLSLYWMTSTLIALVVVTLPGMYPMQAIKTAGDLVIGRRLRLLWRLLWLGLTIAALWLVVMIPLIIFDSWIKGLLPSIEFIPLIPFSLAVMGSLTVVWSASYVYLLYRKVVDDDSAPA